MTETRLPSGDPLSTRSEPEEGTGDPHKLEIKLFPEDAESIVIRLWDDEPEDEDTGVLLPDSDLLTR